MSFHICCGVSCTCFFAFFSQILKLTFWRLKSFNPTATFYLRWQTWWPPGIVIKSASGGKKTANFKHPSSQRPFTVSYYCFFLTQLFLNIFIKNDSTFVTVIQRKTRDIIKKRFSIYDSPTDSWINNKHVCEFMESTWWVMNCCAAFQVMHFSL